MRTLLVANRGEIALRVMRTAAARGLRTVAIHTDLDVDAPHVHAADDAVRVESYLDIEAVLAATVAAGADAVHPGYGFLSERAALARAVLGAGLVWVGPTPEVMEQMGRKDAAREIAVAAGVPVVPRGEDAGFPVLVKAAAGGGGKGMRVVRRQADLADATAAARREAMAAFGDDTMLVEKYVEHGRHVEVQVIGDEHGTVLHLGERDCSTQRRHQKVLEEAPAPTLAEDTRTRLRQAGVDLAAHVGYTGAGTVEFLLDLETGDFYFLEMNTRLQVEHPVTEAVTGLDLVELQLRVAAGEPLGLTQDDVVLTGHAIEARIYAEDAWAGFLPQAGTASLVRWPTGLPGVRVDHALESRQVVSAAYDPMLGKVIAHGPDREAARAALIEALDATAILGLTTNTGFLRALLATTQFRDAVIDTAWLDTASSDTASSDTASLRAPDAALPRRLAAWVSAMLTSFDTGHAFAADGFRLGGPPAPVLVRFDQDVVVDRAAGTVDGRAVRELGAADHVLDVVIEGRRVRAVVNVQPGVSEVSLHGQRFVFGPPERSGALASQSEARVVAPMPGTVLEVRVAEGSEVDAGDVLATMEAMKMELSLTAPTHGTVGVRVRAGQTVSLGDVLFEVTAIEDET